MNISDPIADMLTRIRNAGMSGKNKVDMPYSRMKSELARILKREGYIIDYMTDEQDGKRSLTIHLKYDQKLQPVITGLKRVSRPGLRQYVSPKSIKKVLGGLGIAILSTSSGIMTDEDARKNNVGGEVLCNIW